MGFKLVYLKEAFQAVCRDSTLKSLQNFPLHRQLLLQQTVCLVIEADAAAESDELSRSTAAMAVATEGFSATTSTTFTVRI